MTCLHDTLKILPLNLNKTSTLRINVATMDLIAFGHHTHDILINQEGKQTETLGGAVSYINAILKHANLNFKIVSKVGADFKYLNECKDPPIIEPDHTTTSFVNDYQYGERRELVSHICADINANEVKQQSKVGLICGILNEVRVDAARKIISHSKYTICDIQGIIRRRGQDNRLYYVHLENTPFYPLIEHFTAIKVNEKESEFIDIQKVKLKTMIIITKAEKGSILIHRDFVRSYPAFKVPLVDSTGAGDTFLAGFAYGLVKEFSLDRQMILANKLGSICVQHLGIPNLKQM